MLVAALCQVMPFPNTGPSSVCCHCDRTKRSIGDGPHTRYAGDRVPPPASVYVRPSSDGLALDV